MRNKLNTASTQLRPDSLETLYGLNDLSRKLCDGLCRELVSYGYRGEVSVIGSGFILRGTTEDPSTFTVERLESVNVWV